MDMHKDTWLISQGRPTELGDPLNHPPAMASNFRLPDERYYNRTEGTETQNALEDLLGGLEGGRSLVFGSGMAAIATVFAGLPVGSTLVIPEDPYHATNGLAVEGEEQGRWTVRRLDLTDTDAWVAAASDSDLLWVETPANPLMTVADLPAICRAPRKPGCLVAVDGTFATPLVQRPLELGADISMHSVTKFIGGHSDLMAGSLTMCDDLLYDDLWDRRVRYGGTIGGLEAFLAIRGARTLGLRMERSMSNAQILAERLQEHAEVATVRYPGLVSHDTHENAAKFMDGYGAMMSFDVTGSGERASAVVEHTTIINNATSLGGIESTWERRALIAGQESMPPTLIRFSVGCEHVEDLWADITNALDNTAGR
ncbi:MAG: cystathionine gamma-synthase [Verrucomicrobiales bacterium]|jgi:cystathionine gamma-synthase